MQTAIEKVGLAIRGGTRSRTTPEMGGAGMLITIDKEGTISLPFNRQDVPGPRRFDWPGGH